MNAIELGTGDEVTGFPVKIEGEAANLPGEHVKLEPAQQLQRPALLMLNGVVYAGFGSHCDTEPYEGWIVGVSTAGRVTTKWATSAHGGSIWQSGGGLVSDGPGQIIFSTGNDNSTPGAWDPPKGPGNAPPEGKLGESVVRVEVQPTGTLKATDFFSPFNNTELDEGDIDLGSSAPTALPPQFGTKSTPNLLVQEGKNGYLYLLNRDDLGGMGQSAGGEDEVVQRLGPYGSVWGGAAVWPGEGGYLYIPSGAPAGSASGSSEQLRIFKHAENGAGEPALSLVATSTDGFGFGSGSPIVTSDRTTGGTAIVWVTRCQPTSCENAGLRAYSPVPVAGEPQVLWEAPIGTANKFSRPDASAGHIYVGNREGDVFGYSGPELATSVETLELGSTPVEGRLTGAVTFTDTGTPLTVSAVHGPSGPFEATGLPAVGTKIEPGETITVHVTFKAATAGEFTGALGLTTEAGETDIALSGVATASPPEPAKIPEPGPTVTTASLATAPGPLGPLPAISGPLAPTLTQLGIRVVAPGHKRHRRKAVIRYVLSTAGTVDLIVERRAIGHRCRDHARTCIRWVATTIKLEAAGHAAANVLTLNIDGLRTGSYRLDATPIARSGVSGVTRYVRFTVGR